MMRRFFPSTIRQVGVFVPITDTSYDSFGFERFYLPELPVTQLSRDNADITTFDWDDGFVDLDAIDAYIAVNPSAIFRVRFVHGQKLPISDVSIGVNTSNTRFIRSDADHSKPCLYFNFNEAYQIQNQLTQVSRNKAFFAVTCLVKNNGTVTGGTQPIIYFPTHTQSTRTSRVLLYKNDPSTGFQIFGRRVTNDAGWSAFSNLNGNQWRVVTGIWDFANRELILRIDGNQVDINTSFGSGGNSEDTNPIIPPYLAGNPSNFYFAGITFWGGAKPDISEIINIENRYKAYAGIA